MSEFSVKSEDFSAPAAQLLNMGPIIWEVWTNVERATFTFLCCLFALFVAACGGFHQTGKEACLYYRILILTLWRKKQTCCELLNMPQLDPSSKNPGGLSAKGNWIHGAPSFVQSVSVASVVSCRGFHFFFLSICVALKMMSMGRIFLT